MWEINPLIGWYKEEAIVDSVSGVTRDNYGKRSGTEEFSVIDTGGYVRGSDDVLKAKP
jgi:GTP-binding protein